MESMRAHGQLSVFIGVMIEQVIVPIPSPLIVMGAGAILILPELSIPNAFLQILWIIVLPGAIASTLGSYIGYMISYYGGKALVVRFQRFLDVDWEEIGHLEKRFQGKKEAISIFLSRAIPVFPISLVSIFAGLLRIPIKPFTLYTFLGFHISMPVPWLCRMVDRRHLRKSGNPFRFSGDNHLDIDVDRNGRSPMVSLP